MASSSSSSSATSWIPVPDDSDFSSDNIPFGVFSVTAGKVPRQRCATIVGDTVIDLSKLEEAGVFDACAGLTPGTFMNHSSLNAFVRHEKAVWTAVRNVLREQVTDANSLLATTVALQRAAFHPVDTVTMHVPVEIGDYTDFYASKEHAETCGTIVRGKDNAMQPNWFHLPVGYHGRSSTVVVSPYTFPRPHGQVPTSATSSIHAATRALDLELEMGILVGGPENAQPHEPLTLQQAKNRIFGYVLLNDWSARDVQAWEMVPLGPFTSKNFVTVISPWIVTTDALQPYQAPTSAGPQQTNPKPLPYLYDPDYSSYNVALQVKLSPASSSPSSSSSPAVPDAVVYTVSTSNMKNLYWTAAQMLTHHTVTGCTLRAGDLLGTGTISGRGPEHAGSFLEASWNATRDVILVQENKNKNDKDESSAVLTRRYVQDGDTIILTAVAGGDDDDETRQPKQQRVGFGECRATVLPALPIPPPTTTAMTTTTTPSVPTAEPVNNSTTSTTMTSGSGGSAAAGGVQYSNWKLYSSYMSSSAWRVRLALAAKQIPYQYIPVNLSAAANESATAANNALGPLGQVPVLEFTITTQTTTGTTTTETTRRLTQSVAICEFLDEAFPNRPCLLPPNHEDPLGRAVAREMIQVINAGTQPLQNVYALKRYYYSTTTDKEKEEKEDEKIMQMARAVNERGLTALEALVVKRRGELGGACGPYCLGTFRPTLVDMYMVPQLYNARERFGMDVAKFCPTLVEMDRHCSQHRWFQAAHPMVQPDAPK